MNDTVTLPDKVLSIKQPWASLVLSGLKDIENRTWETMWRGRIVVHAGKKIDPFGYEVGERWGFNPDDLPRGAYLGTVELVDIHHGTTPSCCAWGEPGVYHWRMWRSDPWLTPIPGPGRLGLYPTPPEVRAELERLRSNE